VAVSRLIGLGTFVGPGTFVGLGRFVRPKGGEPLPGFVLARLRIGALLLGGSQLVLQIAQPLEVCPLLLDRQLRHARLGQRGGRLPIRGALRLPLGILGEPLLLVAIGVELFETSQLVAAQPIHPRRECGEPGVDRRQFGHQFGQLPAIGEPLQFATCLARGVALGMETIEPLFLAAKLLLIADAGVQLLLGPLPLALERPSLARGGREDVVFTQRGQIVTAGHLARELRGQRVIEPRAQEQVVDRDRVTSGKARRRQRRRFDGPAFALAAAALALALDPHA